MRRRYQKDWQRDLYRAFSINMTREPEAIGTLPDRSILVCQMPLHRSNGSHRANVLVLRQLVHVGPLH